MSLFWTHEEDSFGQFEEEIDFEKKEQFKFEEFQMGLGVMLQTVNPIYEDVLKNEEELNQYISVISTQEIFDKTSIIGTSKSINI